MDETELIAAARSGDEDAFTALYQKHLGYVKAVGRAILRRNDVDDLCQDTFLLAFTRLNRFEGNSQFRTWLTRIAINQCLLILRRGHRMNSEANDGLLEECILEDKYLEGLPARLDLDRLLQRLKPMQRRLLEMAYVEEMPEQEIAEALGTTRDCVKSSIYRAKQRAREISKWQ
jgi:RNA polymerase sigma-70 factor, ECF subfamily